MSAVPLLLSLTQSSHTFYQRSHTLYQRRTPPPLACDGAGDDPWHVLGVPTSATRQEIKAAFRTRAQLLHPDVNDAPDAAVRFQELVTAFKLLQDETVRADWHSRSMRRAARDRAARAWDSRPKSSPPPPPAYSSRRTASPGDTVARTAAERAARSWESIQEAARAAVASPPNRPAPPPSNPAPPPSRPPTATTAGPTGGWERVWQTPASRPQQARSDVDAEDVPPFGLAREVLEVELADCRHRLAKHREREQWLSEQLVHTEERAAQWRCEVSTEPSERELVAMETELQLLQLATRLRCRLGEQQRATTELSRDADSLARRLAALGERHAESQSG